MSATMGTRQALTIVFSALVDSSSGQETRTMSAPASSMRLTCAMVALASEVSVLVMDCTEMGASPPTSTEPTRIFRDLRLRMSLYGRMLMLTVRLAPLDVLGIK